MIFIVLLCSLGRKTLITLLKIILVLGRWKWQWLWWGVYWARQWRSSLCSWWVEPEVKGHDTPKMKQPKHNSSNLKMFMKLLVETVNKCHIHVLSSFHYNKCSVNACKLNKSNLRILHCFKPFPINWHKCQPSLAVNVCVDL